MALRLRRGTNLERQSIIFEEGELVYVTDTKELWIGDGQTLGGVVVKGYTTTSPAELTQNLDLNTFDIVGGGNIDIAGAVIANSFVGDGSGLTNLYMSVNPGQEYDISIRGNVVGSDSSIIFDFDLNKVTANLAGDGSLISNISLSQLEDVNLLQANEGDVLTRVNGVWTSVVVDSIINNNSYALNIIGGDSSILVDYANSKVNGTLNGNVVYSDATPLIDNTDGSIYPHTIGGQVVDVTSKFVMIGDINKNTIEFELRNEAVDLLSSSADRGSIFFSRNDVNGKVYEALIGGGAGGIYFTIDSTGQTFPESNVVLLTNEGKLGVGTYTPQQKLDVRGNVTATGFVQFGRLTATERGTLTAQNGMVIYNTTANKFQGYQNGGWINLDDGSAA